MKNETKEFKWEDLRVDRVQIIKNNRGKVYSVHRFWYTFIHKHKGVILLCLNNYDISGMAKRFTKEEFNEEKWEIVYLSK